MVHGRPAYIDARTPRVKGAKPGSPGSQSSTSSAVYRGLTSIPSGVCQVRSLPLTSLSASAFQSSVVATGGLHDLGQHAAHVLRVDEEDRGAVRADARLAQHLG